MAENTATSGTLSVLDELQKKEKEVEQLKAKVAEQQAPQQPVPTGPAEVVAPQTPQGVAPVAAPEPTPVQAVTEGKAAVQEAIAATAESAPQKTEIVDLGDGDQIVSVVGKPPKPPTEPLKATVGEIAASHETPAAPAPVAASAAPAETPSPAAPATTPTEAPAPAEKNYGTTKTGQPKKKPGPKPKPKVAKPAESGPAPHGTKGDGSPKKKPGPKPKASGQPGTGSWSQSAESDKKVSIDEMNKTEKAVVTALSGLTEAMAHPKTISEIADIAFPDAGDPKTANIRARNGLRRPVRDGYIKKVGRGKYIPTKKLIAQLSGKILAASNS
jgi:hypothetical protein